LALLASGHLENENKPNYPPLFLLEGNNDEV